MTDLQYIFLLSSDRSGSNLLLRLMGSHSEIIAPPTSQILPNIYKFAGNYLPFRSQENWDSLLENIQNLHRAGFGQWADYGDLQKVLSNKSERSIKIILKTIFETEANAKTSNIIAVKAHRAFDYAGALKTDFPNATFIHLTRDPRDMALSWLKTPALRGGIARAASIWKEEQAGLIELHEKQDIPVYRLRYEDILSSPEQSLRCLCQVLNVEYDPGMLKFHASSDTLNLAGHVQAWNNLAKPLMSQNQSKYKSHLTLEQRAHIEAICEPEMGRFGYRAELDLDKFDLAAIADELIENAPWEKPGYAKLSQAERDSHVRLRHAVNQLRAGPKFMAQRVSGASL